MENKLKKIKGRIGPDEKPVYQYKNMFVSLAADAYCSYIYVWVEDADGKHYNTGGFGKSLKFVKENLDDVYEYALKRVKEKYGKEF